MRGSVNLVLFLILAGLSLVAGTVAFTETPAVREAAAPALTPAPRRQDLAARIDALRPRGEEERYKDVAFTDDPFEALRLAREHRRPILAYYNDGPLGRC